MTILTQNSRMSTEAQLLHVCLAVRNFHVANVDHKQHVSKTQMKSMLR